MTKLYFLAAVYNEAEEIQDLIDSVAPHVDGYAICDDGSTDRTPMILLDNWWEHNFESDPVEFEYHVMEHTGLPETVKNKALDLVPDFSWVLMLDADERLDQETLNQIRRWIDNVDDDESLYIDYVYFRQVEIIDGKIVREFQKCKLFRKESVQFPLNNIHADDQFQGAGIYRGDWIVQHRKSSTKQIVRETEYLATYKKLLEEGKIDEGRYRWLIGLHQFVTPHG